MGTGRQIEQRRSAPVTPPDMFIGRQPIYNRELGVVAYELLYRNSEENRATITDVDSASSQMIFDALVDFGLDQLTGSRRAFLNMTHGLLVGGKPLALPEDRVVLEILETVTVDDALIEAVGQLVSKGYTIALDDFFFSESWRPLVELAHIIKVDVLALGREGVQRQLEVLSKYPLKLLAEKVEDQEEFEFCRKQGFDYFQGYFFCKPKVIRGRRIPANRLAMLRLLADLHNPDVNVAALDTLISQDVTLSYRLLKYINSAAFGLASPIESIRHALVLLGLRNVQRWATLISLSEIDDKPHELMVTAMVRAKMCELLAGVLYPAEAAACFTVGLFSVLDALMDMPLDEVLQPLNLAEEIVGALLLKTGPAGQLLSCVLAFERGQWEYLGALSIPAATIQRAYLDAIAWTDQTVQAMNTEPVR